MHQPRLWYDRERILGCNSTTADGDSDNSRGSKAGRLGVACVVSKQHRRLLCGVEGRTPAADQLTTPSSIIHALQYRNQCDSRDCLAATSVIGHYPPERCGVANFFCMNCVSGSAQLLGTIHHRSFRRSDPSATSRPLVDSQSSACPAARSPHCATHTPTHSAHPC